MLLLDCGTLTVVYVKDHLELIQSVSPKCFGVEPIKSLAVQKIKKYAVLTLKVQLFGNSKDTVIG